jgi:hypothetical protein
MVHLVEFGNSDNFYLDWQIWKVDNLGPHTPLTLCSIEHLFLEHNVKELFGPFLSYINL